jgi:hypothetical protein
MIRQRVHLRELVVDACRECERIESVALAFEGRDLHGVGLCADADAVQRGLRRIVVPAEPRADAFFALKFHRRQEEILQQPQIGALVHESELARNDPNPQAGHLPMAYDTGLPR